MESISGPSVEHESPDAVSASNDTTARESSLREIVAALRRITRAIDQHSRSLAKRYGLTAPQILILDELTKNGPLAIGALARRVYLSQGTVSEIVDRLEKAGYVERHPDVEDRRRVECRPTARADELLAQQPSLLHDRFSAELQRRPDWEQSFLLSALQRIADMMEAPGLDGAEEP